MFYNFRNFVSMFDIFVYVQFIREVDGVVIQLIKMMLMFFFVSYFVGYWGQGGEQIRYSFCFYVVYFQGEKGNYLRVIKM